MAITKQVFIESITVLEDGQIDVVSRTQYFDEGLVVTSRKDTRRIDVGDNVAAESGLIKDVVNGNLHSQSRRDARDTARAAEAERRRGDPPPRTP